MSLARTKASGESPGPILAAAAPVPDDLARRLGKARMSLTRLIRPSITHRVFLVGAIPILAAVFIGIASLFLLNRADDARRGALTVATVFRQVVTAINERDAFLQATAAERSRRRTLFVGSLDAASQGLKDLVETTRDADHLDAIRSSEAWLDRFRTGMNELELAVQRNDRLVATMRERLRGLLTLTEDARQRQHASNANVVATLKRNDEALRNVQNIVTSAGLARTALADRELDHARTPSAPDDPFAAVHAANAIADLSAVLRGANLVQEANQLDGLFRAYEANGNGNATLAWLDQRMKIDGTAARALQDKVAELLAYTVEAHETEQATQNIAVETMRLTAAADEAISSRNIAGIGRAVPESEALSSRIAALPISPLIQTEMLDALDVWRSGLEETSAGLAEQNNILTFMTDASNALVFEVSTLNSELARNADAIGTKARRILALGALSGLLAGAVFAFLVARSITTRLKRLEHDMLDRALNPGAGPLVGHPRADEIGHMALATNRFLSELGKRESALRKEKERTEETLSELKRTQRELIQSEKLASLGQLVAGVAHEINTPLGIALTTSTVMRDELRSFGTNVREGRVTRASFDRFVERLEDGIRLTTTNLERSAQLVVSFKQVAADRASGERRGFDLKTFLDELFISLRPLGKRFGHRIVLDCEAGVEMLSYPGALAQVLTNLVTNAYTHAFEASDGGTIRIEATKAGPEHVRIVFADDGRGVDPRNRARIFDPFFTTGRATGSTGLGLHIVFNLVSGTLGGTIDVESEVGRGTRFVIGLPRRRPATSETADA